MFNHRRGGRGRGRSSNRPSLPFKITKELDIDSAGTPKPKSRGSMFRVSQRKEQRKAARRKDRTHPRAAPNRPAASSDGKPQKEFRKTQMANEQVHPVNCRPVLATLQSRHADMLVLIHHVYSGGAKRGLFTGEKTSRAILRGTSKQQQKDKVCGAAEQGGE